MKLGELFECKLGRGELVLTKIIDDNSFEVSNYKGSWIQKKHDVDKVIYKIHSSSSRYFYDPLKQAAYVSQLLYAHSIDVINEEINILKALYGVINSEALQCLNTIYNNGDNYRKHSSDFKDETDPTFAVDYSRGRISILDEVAKSCFFARIDFEYNGKTERHYIGKQGYNSKMYKIVDWRSEIAQYYYMKTQSTFEMKKHELKVTQRFEYLIENFILKNINPQFVNIPSLDDKEGVILDPFLISILKDKRRSKELEDIIMTIQNKQYEILSFEPSSSLLVQGCAGSGKTMVLLHRISYLIFNKYYKVQDILIITPNKNFYSLLDGLMSKLEISSVENTTIYHYLSKSYEYYYGESLEFSYPEVLDIKIREYHNFIFKFQNHVSDYLFEILNKKIDSKLLSIIKKYNLDYEDNPKKSYYDRLKAINGNLILTVEKDDQLTQNINTKSQRVIELLNNAILENRNKKYEDEALIDEKQRKKEQLNIEINNVYSKTEKIQQEIQEQNSQITHLEKEELIITNEMNMLNKETIPRIQREFEENLTTINIREKNLIKLSKRKDAISKGIQFIGLVFKPFLSDDRKDRIESSLISISSEMKILESEIENLRNSNMSKEDEISLLKNRYLDMYSKLTNLEDEKVKKKKKIKEIEQTLSSLEIYKIEISQQIDDCTTSIQRASTRIENYKERIAKDQERIKHIAFYTTKLIKKEFTNDEGDYYLEELNLQYGDYRRRLVGSVGSIEGKLLTMEYYNYFNDKIEKVDNMPNLIAFINDFIENNDLCINDAQTKLRLRLIAAIIYKGKSNNKKIALIDEAQDYSVIDFEIINSINSDKGIYMNFFGDSQQNINLTHESNWNMLMRNFSVKMFKLNENYRNSVEITKYYNERIGRNDLSIGISSGPVIEVLCFKEAIEQLIDCPNYRKVIVVKSTNSAISKNITALLGNKINAIDDSTGIDFTRISLLSVQSVKGMEFDTALVITNDLTNNEEYVALTRALHKLIVCKA